MRCLVTGGAGFIGTNLVIRLLQEGHTVTVWDNLSTGKRENIPASPHGHLNFYEIDVAGVNPEHHVEKRYDIIYHLAAHARIQPSFKSPDEAFKSNDLGTLKMLELARKHDIPLVYAGSSSFYHDKYANPYTFTKWIGEELCVMYNKVYKVPTAIARFFNVYGPYQIQEGPFATVMGVFEKCKKEGTAFPITGTGEQRRDFTHVDDVVDGLLKVGAKRWNADIFNFGTGINYSVKDIARMYKPSAANYVPGRPGEAPATLAEIEETKKVLKWAPKIKVQDYIKEFVKTCE
jgi:UDP-glucose 4-epimerase